MSTTQTWILDALPEWTQPRGLVLVGSERVDLGWQDQEGLDLGEILTLFGTPNAARARLSWNWRGAVWGEVPDLAGVALVSTSTGGRVPLEEVPRLVGHALTATGLQALGSSASMAQSGRCQRRALPATFRKRVS
jgi:hypothetical protein